MFINSTRLGRSQESLPPWRAAPAPSAAALACLGPEPDEYGPGHEAVDGAVDQELDRRSPAHALPDRILEMAHGIAQDRRCAREAEDLLALGARAAQRVPADV